MTDDTDASAAAYDLVAAARSKSSPAAKKDRKGIRKLGRRLDAARSLEAKRLRQSARAQRMLEKRERQAADAAAEVRVVVGRIREAAQAAVDRTGEVTPRPDPEPLTTATSRETPPRKPRAPTRRASTRSSKPTA